MKEINTNDALRTELLKCKAGKTKEERKEIFTTRLKDFLLSHPAVVFDVEKIFDKELEKWRETLIFRLGYLQRIEKMDISVNSDYTRFRLLRCESTDTLP